MMKDPEGIYVWKAPDKFAQLRVGSRSSLLVLYLLQDWAKSEDPDQTRDAQADLESHCSHIVFYLKIFSFWR